MRRQNTVIEHQASPADAAHTPVRIDARGKRQHVASHARRFLASHRTNNTVRTTSNQAHLGMRLECSPGLADTSARSPRPCRGLVSSPGHNAHASAPFISRSSDSEGCCSAVDLGWVYATVASHQTWCRPGHGDSTFEPSLLTSRRSRPRSTNPHVVRPGRLAGSRSVRPLRLDDAGCGDGRQAQPEVLRDHLARGPARGCLYASGHRTLEGEDQALDGPRPRASA